MSIGDQIRALRKLKGYTTKELAVKAGIAQSSVSDIENNKTSPSIDTLDKLLSALDISLADFFADNNRQYPYIVQITTALKKLSSDEQKALSDYLQARISVE